MRKNVTQKLIANHLIEGHMQQGEEIALKIDQTLTQDATGTLALLEFEAIGIPRIRTELSAQYVDHNLFSYTSQSGSYLHPKICFYAAPARSSVFGTAGREMA